MALTLSITTTVLLGFKSAVGPLIVSAHSTTVTAGVTAGEISTMGDLEILKDLTSSLEEVSDFLQLALDLLLALLLAVLLALAAILLEAGGITVVLSRLVSVLTSLIARGGSRSVGVRILVRRGCVLGRGGVLSSGGGGRLVLVSIADLRIRILVLVGGAVGSRHFQGFRTGINTQN